MQTAISTATVKVSNGCPVCSSPHPDTSIQTTAEMAGGADGFNEIFQGIHNKMCQAHRLQLIGVIARRANL